MDKISLSQLFSIMLLESSYYEFAEFSRDELRAFRTEIR